MLIAIWWRPPSFFSLIGLPVDAPSFQVRSSFVNYMQSQFKDWSMTSSQSPTEFDQTVLQSRIRPLENLYHKLMSSENRRLYSIYGQDAFLCDWCSTELDYGIVASCGVVGSYAVFLLLVGVGTIVWRKKTLQPWILVASLVLLAIEVASMTILEDNPVSLLTEGLLSDLAFNEVFVVRYFLFALCMLGAAAYSESDDWTDRDILQLVLQKAQFNYARLDAAMLAREAALSDDQLRKKYLDFHAGHRKHSQSAPVKDATQTETLRSQVLKKFSVARVINNKEAIDHFIKMAVNEQILTSVDLPPIQETQNETKKDK